MPGMPVWALVIIAILVFILGMMFAGRRPW